MFDEPSERRSSILRASSVRPFRTSHHGDSGANGRPMSRRTGKIHCSALRGHKGHRHQLLESVWNEGDVQW